MVWETMIKEKPLIKECKDCFGFSCIIVKEGQELNCPCRECIVKTTCFSNTCIEFEELLDKIHSIKHGIQEGIYVTRM